MKKMILKNGIQQFLDEKFNFIEFWNPKDGFYARTNILDKNGNETDKEAFMRSFPALIDIGIMGHCLHGQSGLCKKAGIECYQNGFTKTNANMSLDNYKKLINEGKEKGLQQCALGGAGDVDQHENFEEILKYTRDSGIVPNFTTSGLGLTKEKTEICKKYCGAVAVSMYSRLNSSTLASIKDDVKVLFTLGGTNEDCRLSEKNDCDYIVSEDYYYKALSEGDFVVIEEENEENNYTMKAVDNLLKAGVITNIHYVLGKNSIKEAIIRLKNNGFPKGINAVIFLLHKPVGQGTKENMLNIEDEKVKEFFELIDTGKFDFKIGFDSCTIPGIVNLSKNINRDSIDTCEGSRFSCYIDAQMNMMPCSFDNEQLRWSESLNNKTIEEVWNSDKFNSFRKSLQNSCTGCKNKEVCMGGCPIVPEIVLCDSKEKDLYHQKLPTIKLEL